MKKINLLSFIAAGVFVASCNGVGGSSNTTSTSGGACSASNTQQPCGAPVGSVPTVYSQAISPATSNLVSTTTLNGTLTSTSGLYLSSTESYPLTVEVNGNTADITANFTIVADDASIPSGSQLPTMTPQQCVFAAANPVPCNLNITMNGAPVGKYKVIPQIDGAATFTGVELNFQLPTQLTLPYGTYGISGQSFQMVPDSQGGLTSCSLISLPESFTVVNTVNGSYSCSNSSSFSGCYYGGVALKPIDLPSFSSYVDNEFYPAFYTYATNANWSGSVLSYTSSIDLSACNGLLATQSMTLQSSSTALPYPIINSSTTVSANKNMNKLLLGGPLVNN